MSWVIAAPEYVAAAATDLANVGSTLESANSFAAGPTSSVFPPGADEVSAVIAALFDAHSQAYQELSAQAAAYHAQFVQLMNGGAEQYALTEAANASPLQTQHALSPAGSAGQALTSAPSLAGSAATPASAVAGVPAATAGLTGSAPPAAVAPAPPIAPAPPPVTPSAFTPAGAGPVASAGLGSTGTPGPPMQPATTSYAAPATEPAPLAEPAPVATTTTEAPAISPPTAATPLAATPLTAAPQSTSAYRPATAAYSVGAAEEQSPTTGQA